MEHHDRQDKIVNCIAVFCNFKLHGIMVMNLRQHGDPLLIQHTLNPIHHLPYLRLQEKAGGSHLFRGKGKCVQPQLGKPLVHQKTQRAFHVIPGRFVLQIQIHLFIIKGTPDLFRGPVPKCDFFTGCAWLPFIE